MSSIAPARAGEARIVARRGEVDPGTDYVAPSGAMETRLAAMWQSALSIDQVGRKDSFFELGGDSLRAIDLLMRVEKELGVVLPASTIIDHPTIEQLAALLAGNTRADAERILITLQSEGADPPLFFLHAMDNAVFGYRLLAQHLGRARKMYALVSAGQGQHPSPAPSIPAMAEAYANVIKTVQANGPYFLVGYCLGGTLAYEVARQLREQGLQVALLVLIDAGTRDRSISSLNRLSRKLSHHLAELSDRAPKEWCIYLWEKVRKESNRTVMKTFARPTEIKDAAEQQLLAAYSTYAPPQYDGDIKVIRCAEGRFGPLHLGWAAHVKGAIEVCNLPIGHAAALAEPAVALQLRLWLDAIEVPQKTPSA
jgi:thioesterase domain-containing protein/acyl carrier protein